MAILFDGRLSSGTFAPYNRVDIAPGSSDVPPIHAGREGYYERVLDPIGGARYVAKLTAYSGAPGRCEMRPSVEDPPGPGPDYGTRWFYFETLFLDWPIDRSSSVTASISSKLGDARDMIAQLHDTADVGDTTHQPPFMLAVEGERIYFYTSYDTSATTVSAAPNLRVLQSFPLDRGRWIKWALHIKYTINNDGFMHLYKDRRKVYSVTATPTAYNDTVGPFFKSGIYKFFGTNSPESRTIYHSGIVVGDADSSYLEVAGEDALDTTSARSGI